MARESVTFSRLGESWEIERSIAELLDEHVLALNEDGSYKKSGPFNQYLFRLAFVCDAMKNSIGSGFELVQQIGTSEEEPDLDDEIQRSNALEGFTRDLEDQAQLMSLRQECVQAYGAGVLRQLEESIGIDSRGLDAGDRNPFLGADIHKIGAISSYISLGGTPMRERNEKQRQAIQDQLRGNVEKSLEGDN